jgi:hypothetical protein
MTANEFREVALSFSGTTEGAHMRHPDFRANGKVFATLGYPDEAWGMVKLTPNDQRQLIEQHPQVFAQIKGAWGLHGSTSVRLATAKREILVQALELAWQNSAMDSPSKSRKAKVR